MNADTEETVDPIYSLLKSAAGMPSARTPGTSSRGSPVAAVAMTDVVQSSTESGRSKSEGGGGGSQFHRSNSSSPHKSQSPHQRLQQQQQMRKLPPVLHLPGMSIMSPVTPGVLS